MLDEPNSPPVRRVAVLDRAPAQYLAGILGRDAPESELPPMWHTVYLLDRWARADLGTDGHSLKGLPRPPREPHRRMFAGGRAVHLHPLHFGERVVRTTFLESTAAKNGRSGPLTFATVRNEYEQGGRVAVVEEQDIVYLPLGRTTGEALAPEPVEAESIEAEMRFEVDPVTLFMFSTATANAHRIHYDREYARTEGHHDLVVHGPLQVLLMASALSEQAEGFRDREFSYRLLAPARGAQVLRIGTPSAGDAGVVVVDGLGRRVAQAVLAP